MKLPSLLVCLLIAVPVLAPGANKEIEALQRDIAILQQNIKDLQKSQDEKLAAILEGTRAAMDAANRANTSVAVITSSRITAVSRPKATGRLASRPARLVKAMCSPAG